MQIREATLNDVQGILNVLKASLGETSSKKTEDVWRYKHLNNPFGESLVLLAEEAGEIIGVRAFMRWKWQKGEKVYSAFRAVDTATHPKHQGKGIFKKLTLKALEIGQDRGDHFVFNTPNNLSKPGYVKMGWQEVGKVRTTLVVRNPLFWSKSKSLTINETDERIISKNLLSYWTKKLAEEDKLFTPKTQEYIKWRYLDNPLQQYKISVNEKMFIAGYIKVHANFKELRISEVIASSAADKKEMKKEIKKWAKESGVSFISFSASFYPGLFVTGYTGNFGPVLTYKALNIQQKDLTEYVNIHSWAYSLGDLELF